MEAVQVIREDGQIGTVVQRISTAGEASQLIIAFADGSRLVVPEDALDTHPDGTCSLRLNTADLDAAANEIVVPVAAEELTVEKRRVTRGIVRVHKRVKVREEVVDEPLLREEIAVERVPVNQLVEGDVPAPRYEEGVLVIPILEEVLVVEKRLLLKEEVRLSKRRRNISKPQHVTLRREVVEIERITPDEAAVSPTDTAGA